MNKTFIGVIIGGMLTISSARAEEIDLFPVLDTDKSEDISITEFNTFVEMQALEYIKNSGILGDIPFDSPNIRMLKEEIVRGMLNNTKQFFELQDQNGDLVITADEYNNSLFQPLLNIAK